MSLVNITSADRTSHYSFFYLSTLFISLYLCDIVRNGKLWLNSRKKVPIYLVVVKFYFNFSLKHCAILLRIWWTLTITIIQN